MPDFLCLRRNLPQEWLLGNVTVPNPVTATLHGEDGQVPGVPVASLAADSSLMNAILDSDKEEKHIRLVGVEADVISSYVSLLCKGRLQIDENRDTDIRKLRCFLSMIGSKIVVEMEPPAMECGARGHQTKSLTNVDQVQDKGTGVNNYKESEDGVNQSSQMLTILHNEVPPQRERSVSVHTPNTPTPAMNSSRGLSQAQLLTEGDVSKIIVSRPAGSMVSTPPKSDKSRVSNDVTPTVNEVGSGSDNDDDMDIARDIRSADIKKENLEYESLLAPSRFDDDDEVEIVGFNRPKTSNAPTSLSISHRKKAYPCRKCKRVLGNKGAWSKHIVVCHTRTKETKKKKKQGMSTKHFTCVNCQVTFASRFTLQTHQERCQGAEVLAPFKCSQCSKTFARKSTFSFHVRKLCLSLKHGEKENDDIEADLGNHQDGDQQSDDNEEGEHQVTDPAEQEDTRDDHVSCKECGGLFTKEKFERHQVLTGHTGDIIKLPPNLTYE